jgi:phage gp46-like protein
MLKRAEYTAWDNQARADNVYTWAEQMKLNELGSQLWTLETAMKAAKTEYDDAARLQWVMAGSMALVCAFGG